MAVGRLIQACVFRPPDLIYKYTQRSVLNSAEKSSYRSQLSRQAEDYSNPDMTKLYSAEDTDIKTPDARSKPTTVEVPSRFARFQDFIWTGVRHRHGGKQHSDIAWVSS